MKRLGIYAGLGVAQSLEERLAQIKEVGFDVVCLNFEKEMERSEGPWEAQLRQAQRYGLPVHAVHLTGSGMTSIWTDGPQAEAVTERLTDELKTLKTLGLSVGVAHITWGLTPPPKSSEGALRRFERIAEAAEQYGVRLALENSAFARPVHDVLGHIKSPYVGFCYDSGHENAFTPKEDYLAAYGDRLLEMHLHDNNGATDGHLLPFAEGGTVDWQRKLQALNQTKLGREFLILEAVCKEARLEEFLAKAYQTAVKMENSDRSNKREESQ